MFIQYMDTSCFKPVFVKAQCVVDEEKEANRRVPQHVHDFISWVCIHMPDGKAKFSGGILQPIQAAFMGAELYIRQHAGKGLPGPWSCISR